MLGEYLRRSARVLAVLGSRVLILLRRRGLLRRVEDGLAVQTRVLGTVKLGGVGLLLLVREVLVPVGRRLLVGGHAADGVGLGQGRVLLVLQVGSVVRVVLKVVLVNIPEALERRWEGLLLLSRERPVAELGLVKGGGLGSLRAGGSEAGRWIAHPLGRPTGKASGVVVRRIRCGPFVVLLGA